MQQNNSGQVRGYVPRHAAQPYNQPVMQQSVQEYPPKQVQYSHAQQPQQYVQPQQYAQYQQPVQYPPQQVTQPFAPFVQEEPKKAQKNKLLLISAAIAAAWFVFVCIGFGSAGSQTPAGDEFEQAAYEIGTALGIMLQLPSLILSFLGTIFNWVAWGGNRKGFALTAGILFSVAFLMGIGNFFGYIPCIVLCFVGYSQLRKEMV